jgi:50S ribosomal protein L16 3-hydroxylase
MRKKNNIFNKISISKFMQQYWQKKPLLIRAAFPDFKDFLSRDKIISWACQDDAQARLISFKKTWNLQDGPFTKKDFKKIQGHWTLLVQGINHCEDKGDALLKNFNFIPYSRLDDLMVSYAPNGGGVGPHFDSYDVFLLQGSGQRKWQIAKNKNFTLIPDIPLKIIENFTATDEWVLNPGDMLYLPPNYAHNGIAVGDSITYSIGFRAPSSQEIANEFLNYLQDRFNMEDIYSDPELKATKKPAKITIEMIKKIKNMLQQIQFNEEDIQDFYGQYMSEPKPHVSFAQPKRPFKKNDFLKLAKKNGISLHPKTQMLYTSKKIFINGEIIKLKMGINFLAQLADQRESSCPSALSAVCKNFLYEWYLAGFLNIKI